MRPTFKPSNGNLKTKQWLICDIFISSDPIISLLDRHDYFFQNTNMFFKIDLVCYFPNCPHDLGCPRGLGGGRATDCQARSGSPGLGAGGPIRAPRMDRLPTFARGRPASARIVPALQGRLDLFPAGVVFLVGATLVRPSRTGRDGTGIEADGPARTGFQAAAGTAAPSAARNVARPDGHVRSDNMRPARRRPPGGEAVTRPRESRPATGALRRGGTGPRAGA